MAINVLTPDYTKGFGTPLDALTKSLGVVKKTVLPYANPQSVDTSGNVISQSPKVDLTKLPVLPGYATMATPEEKPTALTGMGTGTTGGVPIAPAKPVEQPTGGDMSITADPNVLNKAVTGANGQPAIGMFKDEQDAHSKMLADGLSDTQAKDLIAQRRKDLMGNTKLSPIESYGLLKMQADGLNTQDAVDMLKQMREDRSSARPFWKQVGEQAFNVGAGAAGLATEQVGNVLSAITKPFDESASQGFSKDVADVKNINQDVNNSFGGQVGRKVLGVGEMTAATPSALMTEAPATGLLSTMGGRMAAGAGTFGLQGAMNPILEKGGDVTGKDIALGGLEGAAMGAAAVPVAEKVLAPVLGKAVQYGTTAWKEGTPGIKAALTEDLQDVKNGFIKGMQKLDNATSFLDSAVKPLPSTPTTANGETVGNKIAGWWSNKANRMIDGDIQKFEQMTGVKPGQWAIERGMTDVGDPAVVKATQLWKDSMEQADKGIEAIAGKFSTKGQAIEGFPKQKDIIGKLIDENYQRGLDLPLDADSSISETLKAKYDAEGLSMADINEAKRIYARQHVYNWDERASVPARNSKNLQDAVRNWQFKTAEENGLANLQEINKNTQGWKAYADMLGKSLSRKSANNSVSLTDWISLSGGKPENLAMFLGKKLGEKYASPLALKTLTTQVKPATIEPELGNILKTNVAKDANFNLSDNLNSAGGKSLVRKPQPLQLSAPKGELPSGDVVNVKPQEGLSPGVLGKANKTISGQVGERPAEVPDTVKSVAKKASKKTPKSVSK